MGYYIFLTTSIDNGFTNTSPGSALLDAIIKLIIFLFVVFLAYYSTKLISKAKGVRKGSNLTVLEAVGVGLQGTIQLVKVGEQVFLIGVTKDKISLISEIEPASLKDDAEEGSPLRKLPIPFEQYLNKYFKKNDDGPKQE